MSAGSHCDTRMSVLELSPPPDSLPELSMLPSSVFSFATRSSRSGEENKWRLLRMVAFIYLFIFFNVHWKPHANCGVTTDFSRHQFNLGTETRLNYSI